MTLEEFEQATEQDLRAEANACLARAVDAGSIDKSYHYLQAQFYMGEINRRRDARIVRRDLILELVIICLIILEIVIGTAGIYVSIEEGAGQARVMGIQTDILSKLQQSSSATAGTLKALQST